MPLSSFGAIYAPFYMPHMPEISSKVKAHVQGCLAPTTTIKFTSSKNKLSFISSNDQRPQTEMIKQVCISVTFSLVFGFVPASTI